jgi:hypothetical protein
VKDDVAPVILESATVAVLSVLEAVVAVKFENVVKSLEVKEGIS